MIVAVLEDCPVQLDWVTKLLNGRGYQVVARRDGDSFLALLRNQSVDAALLDWEVPGASGLSVLRWARENLQRSLPILMLTQRDDEDDIVTALQAGADDYLHKPVRERELLARVAAQARRSHHADGVDQEFQVGLFSFNVSARTLMIDRKAVRLPVREFELAALLFRNPGRILTKDALCQHIWGKIDRCYDASLATYISNLRARLGLRAQWLRDLHCLQPRLSIGTRGGDRDSPPRGVSLPR